MRILDIADVLTNLDKLVDEAAEGNAFVISVNGIPKFEVQPLEEEDFERLSQPGD